MRLFRRFRFKNIGKQKFKKYLLYAIGEILLIVIGVLVAINVNNSNEEKKKEKQLSAIIEKVNLNLENDMSSLNEIIKGYEKLDTVTFEIITDKYAQSHLDTISPSNYDNCIPCFANHISFEPFFPKLDGYEQLKSVNLDWNTANNETSQNILLFYQEQLRNLKLIEENMTPVLLNNLRSIEKYNWYTDYMLGKYNEESIQYFTFSEIYRNKLMTYRILAIENYLSMLKMYRKEATELLSSLNNR